MIAVDTSSWIAYLGGDEGRDTVLVEHALAERQVCLPAVVLTELLSDPKLPKRVESLLRQLPLLVITHGFWERAGRLRARLLAVKKRARLADSLIAQNCLDHDVPVVSRDSDFRHFETVAGLKLLV